MGDDGRISRGKKGALATARIWLTTQISDLVPKRPMTTEDRYASVYSSERPFHRDTRLTVLSCNKIENFPEPREAFPVCEKKKSTKKSSGHNQMR